MARTFHDLNDVEKQAFRIYERRLRGDMSTPEEKDEAKRQMEAILWSGPSALVHELKHQIEELSLRVAALEAGLDTPNPCLDFPEPETCPISDGPGGGRAMAKAPSQRTGGAGQSAEPKKENRGRPKRRFAAEKSPAGWQIIDREQPTGHYLPDGPFKTRKECEARAKELEANPAQLDNNVTEVTIDCSDNVVTDEGIDYHIDLGGEPGVKVGPVPEVDIPFG